MTAPDGLELTTIDVTDDVALGRWLAVRNAVDPRPLTPAGLRAELTAATEYLALLATMGDSDVGAAECGWGPMSQESGNAYLDAWVLPGARRRGIGTALVDRCVAFARRHGMVNGRAMAREGDVGAVHFAARYGLEVAGIGQVGHLDLTSAHATAVAAGPPDVVIEGYRERPDLERATFELDVLVQPEVPSLADEPTPSFEAWQAQTAGDPGFRPELSLIAHRDGRVVGAIHVYDNGEGAAFIGMTAVHPAARRQGIARALKVELAARAARDGWRRLETFNDGTNERMRALNEDLGYEYLPRMATLKGPLPTT